VGRTYASSEMYIFTKVVKAKNFRSDIATDITIYNN